MAVTYVLLVLVSVGFVITLGMLLLGPKGTPAPTQAPVKETDAQTPKALEAEVDKKRRELDEMRAQLSDAREQLKQAKRKLYEQKEVERSSRDLVKAREETERSASAQLDKLREELAGAQNEIQRLTQQLSATRERRAPDRPQAAPEPPSSGERAPKPERRIRELSDADKEKMERLEQSAQKERIRAGQLDREAKRLKGRLETQNRVYVVTKGELDLLKDKYKALEKRLNRTLLEHDLARRAIRTLEQSTGKAAERTELTPDEIAASDQAVDEKIRQEAAKVDTRIAQAEKEGATLAEEGEGPTSPGTEAESAPPAKEIQGSA